VTDEAWIDTVRLVRDTGTVRELFPAGVDDVLDLPHTLFDAIGRASIFLGWEELPREEQPPRRIWLNSEALSEWFDEVRRKRARDMDPKNRDHEIEDPVENEAAGMLIGG
jgi:hypothetical protein